MARDEQGRRTLLFLNEWIMNNFRENHPRIFLFDSPK